MIACFGSIAHAPLAVMLMVSEMTGSLALLAPAMVAVGLATLITGDQTIYRSQLRTRADSPGHRVRMRLPLLSTRTVAAVMSAPRLTLAANTPITEALERLRALGLPGLPIVDETDRYRGSLGVATLTEAEKSGAEGPIGQLLDGPAPTLTPDATLDAAVQALATGTHTWLPVVDQGRVMGIVGMSEVITGYRDALRANLNVLVRPSSTVLVEQRLSNHAPVTGRTIAEIIWPAGTLILAIQRKDELIFPDGATSLESGDLVSALANANSADKLEAMLTAPPADEGDGDGDQRMQLI